MATHPTPTGTEVWSDRWTGPRILDKPAVLADDVPTYGLIALTTATARLLPAEGFSRLLENHPSVRAHVLGHLARDITAVRERLVQAVALPAISRVAAWLHAQDPTSGVVWRGSQEHLARLLGLSRVTVNRAIVRLTREGAIRPTPHGIVIADRHRLAALACES